MLCPSPRKHHARLYFPRVIKNEILCLMKDRSILENKVESARTNCPSCSNLTQYSCSELSSHFLSCHLLSGFQDDSLNCCSRLHIPPAISSTRVTSDVLSPPGTSSAEGFWLPGGERRKQFSQQLPQWEIRRLMIPLFYICAVF